jgi:hypothetical protein
MRKAILLAAASIPLLAFDCGGKETPATTTPLGSCTVQVRGAVSEDLWCVATAADYSAMAGSSSTQWAFEIVAYRGSPISGAQPDLGVGIGFFLPARPALATDYGWTPTASTVDGGSASRTIGSAQGGTVVYTHEATSVLDALDVGTGELTARFTAIPPATATGAAMMDVHGTVDATVPSVDPAGAPITLHAAF